MILVEGEKYACIQCIRGHRSSTCQHTKRPLVQVRSRGRPSNLSGHRVAVFADQNGSKDLDLGLPVSKVSLDKIRRRSIPSGKVDKSCGSGCACCPTKSLSTGGKVIVLRASNRQFVDVSDGSLKIVGSYEDGDQPMIASYPLNPSTHYSSKASSTSANGHEVKSCCGGSAQEQPKQLEFQENIIRLGNYKSIPSKKEDVTKPETPVPSSTVGSEIGSELPINLSNIKPEESNGISNFAYQATGSFEQPPWQLPYILDHSTCGCDDNCACDLCIVHGNVPRQFQSTVGQGMAASFSYEHSVRQEAPLHITDKRPIENLIDPTFESKNWLQDFNDSTVYDYILANSCTIPGSCGCDDDCTCVGCVDHGNKN